MTTKIRFIKAVARGIYGEGEGTPTATPAATPTATPTGTPTATPTPTPAPQLPEGFPGQVGADGRLVLTQDQLNQYLASNRKTLIKKNEEMASQLKAQVESGRLTAEEKERAEQRIRELTDEFKGKDELHANEVRSLQTKYDKDKANWTAEAKTWQDRYMNSLIERELMDAAVAAKAYNPAQLVKLLRGDSRAQEGTVTDGEDKGKPNGQFTARVKFKGKKDGKEVELDLTPAEVMKMMQGMDEYANQFIAPGSGGLGGGTSNRGGGPIGSIGQMSMADYKKQREGILKAVDENTKEQVG